jgi:molecular chaperone DnaJ
VTAAALGTEADLETLDGMETLDIPPGTHSGEVLVLTARGVPRLRGTGRGDLIVHVEVQTPTRLDAEQEELLRTLARLRDEERPPASGQAASHGLFSRLRDAFNPR